IGAAVNRQFKIVAVSDGILRTSLDTKPAEDATTVIDVVNRRVTFVDADALCGRTRIVGGDDVNTFRRTCSRAEITGHTFLSAKFVDVQKMLASITRLHRDRF